MTKRPDKNTLDLFMDYSPPEVVRRFEEERVRAFSLRSKMAKAVSEALKDCDMDREAVAAAMSEWLGEEVTKNMLDAYASEAREDHNIPHIRLIGLAYVTGDTRLLQVGADPLGLIVTEAKYLDWIELGMTAERRETASQIKDEMDKDFESRVRAMRRKS